ncbi:MAG: OB-fold nucleic acid binding domain-containing protein [Pseudomonadota bacterium]
MDRSAFPPPAGSAGAAHYRGEVSRDGARRREALRAKAEGRPPRPDRAPDEGMAAAPGLAGPRKGWERGRAPSAEVLAGPPSAEPPAPSARAPRYARSAKGAWPLPPACLTAAMLDRPPEKARVAVAGLVVVRQRPGSANGVIFVTLEDETGVTNIVVWQKTYERFRREIIAGRLLRVTGRIQRDGQVVHVVAELIEDLSPLLDDLARGARSMPDPMGPTDEVKRPVDETRPGGRGPSRRGANAGHPRSQAGRIFPSRDFH